MNNLQAWLTLHLTPNLGTIGCQRLVEAFGSPIEVFKAKQTDILRAKGVKKSALTLLANEPPFAAMEKELAKAKAMGVKIVSLDDNEYPALLRTIYAPPVILYLRGSFEVISRPAVAIVGSRAATAYGVKIARKLAADLTMRGVMVVSGMALGIDTAAHYGTLDRGGPTIAVLGCGVDVIYPRQNMKLYGEIMKNGLIVSEYPLGTKPESFRFPSRNRIISGMAMGTVVVEAAKRSGSLITARMAMDEGREVFAIPGRIDSFKSAGTHHLLQEGAKLVNSVEDILEELPMVSSSGKSGQEDNTSKSGKVVNLKVEEEAVLGLLDAYPESMDNLIMRSGLSAAKINEIMLMLEIKGLVEVAPGQQFSLK